MYAGGREEQHHSQLATCHTPLFNEQSHQLTRPLPSLAWLPSPSALRCSAERRLKRKKSRARRRQEGLHVCSHLWHRTPPAPAWRRHAHARFPPALQPAAAPPAARASLRDSTLPPSLRQGMGLGLAKGGQLPRILAAVVAFRLALLQ